MLILMSQCKENENPIAYVRRIAIEKARAGKLLTKNQFSSSCS